MKTSLLIFTSILCLLLCSCSGKGDINPSPSSTGVGGSMARFTISGDYLYTVSTTKLKVFNIKDPKNTLYLNDFQIGTGIETIFPLNSNLFIGSQNGMYIYDISTPFSPELMSNYIHAFSCDPVVADSNYAYVTLRTTGGGRCGTRVLNRLEIVNIKNKYSPFLEKFYNMTGPKGLGIDKKTLFVCDEGLKVFDVSDIYNIKLKNQFFIQANDVIAYKDLLMVIGDDGIHQYNYANDTIIEYSNLKYQY